MNDWYNSLNKAPWTPPNSFFGPIWTILYILMTLAFIRVWSNKKCYPYCTGLTYFLVQLLFNLMWTTIFFKYMMPLYALIDIIIIMIFTYYTYTSFRRIDSVAGKLLIPYMLWLCVAFSLNLYIVINN